MDSYNIDIIDLQNNLNNYNRNNNRSTNNIFAQNYIKRLRMYKRNQKIKKYTYCVILILGLLILLQLTLIYNFNYEFDYIDKIFNKIRFSNYFRSNSNGNGNSNFDYYLFAQTFPISFCKTHKCSGLVNNEFIIHGLWPNFNDGSYPSFCSNEKLDIDFVNNNKDMFLKYWSDNNNILDIDFINHEWTKHGTCSNSSLIKTQSDYFLNTINIRKNVNIYSILKKNNIINNNTCYNKNIIINVIKNSLNVYPKLDCIKYNNKYILSGIYLGYNKNLQLIDIPNSNDFECPNDFFYINNDFY